MADDVAKLKAQLEAAELEQELRQTKERTEQLRQVTVESIVESLTRTSSVDKVQELLDQLDEARRPVRVDQDLRDRVREARQAYRELREARPDEPAAEDATVRPETLLVSSEEI